MQTLPLELGFLGAPSRLRFASRTFTGSAFCGCALSPVAAREFASGGGARG